MRAFTTLLAVLCTALCVTHTFAERFNMLVAYSDPIGEDAWSRTHEIARATLHRNLVASGIESTCRIFQSYKQDELTQILSDILEENETELVVTTSSDYAQTPLDLAAKFPNQRILSFGSKSNKATPNNINSGPIPIEAYFLAGQACGMKTKNNTIGLVALSPTANSWAIANSVYAGASKVNPEVNVILMYTNDFYEPALERAAAGYMVTEFGVDCGISQGQYALDEWAKNRSISVVGIAADFRYEINENVLFSVVYDWLYIYETVAYSILNGNFSGGVERQYGFNHLMQLSAFSTLVENGFELNVTLAKERVANGTDQVFCGDLANFFPRTSSANCMNASEARSQRMYFPAVFNPRNLTIEDITTEIYVHYDDGLGLAVLILNGAVMVLAVFMIINTLVYRNTVIIRSSAYIFCVLVLVGVILGALSSYFWLGYPTDSSCMLRAWLGGLGFSISYGGLIVKNYRIWRIFSVSSLDTKIADSDRALILKGILPMMSLEVIILILWQTIDPMRVYRVYPDESAFLDVNQLYLACRSHDIWPVIIFFVPKGLLLIGGTVVSYKTRDIKSQFKQYKESKEIGWCIMVTVLFAVFTLMVNFMVEYNLLAEVGAFTMAIFAVTASLLGFVFGPKVWRLNVKGDKRMSARQISGGNTSSTRNTSGKHNTVTSEHTANSNDGEEMEVENEP
jgi:basic membrane protein A